MLTGHLLPAHPHPKPGELFSSWLTRIAMANGIKLYQLGQAVFGSGTGIWNRDIDKSVTLEIMSRISARTGTNMAHVFSTTLRSYESILYQHHNPNGNTQWVLPAGIYHRTRRRRGLAYCPLCLFEDTEPYFRKSWRLAFYTVCSKHNSMMLDACPSCNAPIAFFRRELGNRSTSTVDSLVLCHKCGWDLRRTATYSAVTMDAHALISLKSIIEFHDLGWWFCGEQDINYSMQYFDVLHYMATYLTSKIGSNLLRYVENETKHIQMSNQMICRMPIEFRPLYDRHWLILNSLWLLESWPDRFIIACKSSKLTISRITRCERFPYWFESTLKLNLH